MRKKMRNMFIEDQASEGYSSQEEYEEQIQKVEDKKLDKHYQEMLVRRQKEKERLQQKFEELIRNEVIGNTSSSSSHEQESYYDNDPIEGPRLEDPKVWRFKCGRSKVVVELIQQIVKLMPQDCKIVSIFFNPNLKGLIFFEAYFEQDVKTIMKDIMYGQPTYIEPDKCPSLLEVQRSINLQLGQWVRLRNHRSYGSDLGRVMRMNRITNIITLKVIKRNKNGQKEPISWQRENEGEINFSKEQNSEFIYSDIEKEYKCAKIDGFALLKCNVKNIDHNITITDEELQMFFPDVIDRKILVQQAKRELMRRVDVQFKEGQYVRLIGEDDMNSGPQFKIMKIHDDNMMELMCRKDKREYTYLVHASEVRLAFKLYQEVKVVEGPHKGDVGVIICIKQGYVVISTDYGSYKVPHSVLQFGHRDNTTQNELVRFGNGDFQLGCVIESKLQTSVILTLNNELQEIPQSKIETLNFNKVEMNSCGEYFKANDNVRILCGIYANKFGLVKHCINGKLYLFNNLFPRTIILESVDNCTALVSKADHIKKHEQKRFLGQICTIKLGQWKGYRGQIINIKQTQLIVQLEAINQKVMVQESDLNIL